MTLKRFMIRFIIISIMIIVALAEYVEVKGKAKGRKMLNLDELLGRKAKIVTSDPNPEVTIVGGCLVNNRPQFLVELSDGCLDMIDIENIQMIPEEPVVPWWPWNFGTNS